LFSFVNPKAIPDNDDEVDKKYKEISSS